MTTYSCLFAPPHMHGHKVFVENETGRISLADWSGHFPNQTDDGPLFVAPDAEIDVVLHRDKLFGVVPVTVRWQADRRSNVWTELPTLGALRKALPTLTFKATPDVQALLDAVSDLCSKPEEVTA